MLAPTNEQIAYFEKNILAVTFLWNWVLHYKQSLYDAKKEYVKYGLLKSAARRLAREGKIDFALLSDATSKAVDYVLLDMQTAYTRFFKWLKTRKGPKVGRPKFKREGHSFSFIGTIVTETVNDTGEVETTIKVPKLKEPVKIKEHGFVPVGKHAHRVTISKDAGKWFVSVLADFEPDKLPERDTVAGIDVGVRTFATIYDGTKFTKITKPAHFNLFKKKIRHLDKKLARCVKNSANYLKTKAKRARLYYHLRNARKSFLHNLTTELIRKYGKIGIEKLNIQDMLQKAGRKLARDIADCSWYGFRAQLTYKGDWYGTQVKTPDEGRWFPSTKLCPICGNKTIIDDRLCFCETCNLTRDRDEQAAMNLFAEANKP
jgi:putative transposase